MQLTVPGKQLDVGAAQRRHVADSLEAILGKFFGSTVEASVILSREAQLYVAPPTVSEAVIRLDLANHPAMLFRDRAHGGNNLEHRRNDANFGWVGPGAERRN